MKLILLLFGFFLFNIAIHGQESNIDMCDILRHSLKTNSADSITNLLESTLHELTNEEKAELLSIRARLWIQLNKKDLKKKSPGRGQILTNAYNDFSQSINQVSNQNDKLKYTARRFLILEDFEPHYKDYESDLQLLKNKGLRRDNIGLGIAALSKFDGAFWLGAEISILSGYAPTFKVLDDNGNMVAQKKISTSASALVLSYSRNVETDLNDYGFSLLRIEAPLYIDLTRIGYIGGDGRKNHWYYRPEIGIGYALFHLSGGYNFFFKSQGSEDLSNLHLNFRIKHTF